MSERQRRRFLLAVGALLTAPLATRAQPAGKVPRIGILGSQNTPHWEGLRQGLRELGYVEGRTVMIEWRWSEGFTDRFPALAIELVQLRVDVIVASGVQAIRAAKQATSTIPIVMAVSAYPDKVGLVESLARPGGNVTGLSSIGPELGAKRLALLKEIAPTVSRVAYLWNPANPVEEFAFRDVLAVAPVAGVKIESIEVRTPDDFPAAFSAVASNRADALLAVASPVNFQGRQLIVDFALQHRLPSIYEERLFVQAGGLMSYATSFAGLFHRAASYVDKILKGTRPGDLPVEQATKFELVLNLKTAKKLGLNISRDFLARVDELIQ
jgi:putative ABC transport system substrate-binding protein